MVAREYRGITVASLLGAVALQLGLGLAHAAPLWLLAGFCAWLFREPAHHGAMHPLGIVSPVCGRRVRARTGRDPYLDREALELRLQVAWWGPFVVCSPIEGQLVQQWDSWVLDGCKRPGIVICIRTDEGDEVVLALASRVPWLSRIRCAVGERIGHGRSYGMMPLGGSVSVLVGGHARPSELENALVRAGETVIAEILHD